MTTAVIDPDNMTEAEAEAVLTPTDDAPYGYKVDGTPRKGPGGRPPKNSHPTSKAPKPSATRPAGKPRNKPARSGGVDYRQGIIGLASIVALPLKFVSPLDSVAVMIHAENLAEAVNETAKDRPEIASMCDKLLSVGPYGLIIGAVLPLGAQIAVNHGFIPDSMAAMLGAYPRDQLAQMAAIKVAEAEAQAAAGMPETAAA